MWPRVVFVVSLLLGALAPGFAATDSAAGMQSALETLKRANAAVVGLEVTAVADARSAQTLGHRRSGSGVVIGADGLILTIGYLIVEADTIQVTTQDRKTWPARPVAYDQATGFGLLQALMPLKGVSPVRLGDAAQAAAGEPMMVSTGGEDGEVELTHLVSKRPFSGYWEYHIDGALFTSPAVGNHSGAPLFNQRGELLGIGSLFVADALGQSPRVPGNMFVPVDLLKPILEELQSTGSSKQSHRPWLGVTSGEQDGRVVVVRVAAGSPAQAGGIERGDVIVAIDGEPVGSLEAFYKGLWKRARPDDEIRVTLLRGEEMRTITVRGVDRMTMMAKPKGI